MLQSCNGLVPIVASVMTILTTATSLFAYVGHQALGYHTAGNAQRKVVAEEQAICVRSS